ncbi:hypothetical protein [Polaribacter sp.]|uniref:hypothetical protein n=1 Tax=Polaribacter sp. TaxID=1920175 RepID=UPI00404867C6
MNKIKISEIRKFVDKNDGTIKEGMVHGKFNDNSFIVIVKDFDTNEEEDFIINVADFI